MEKEKLRVLIINDMVIFPNNEVRIEYDKNFDKQMSETFDCDDELILIVNPIDESNVDIMSLPNYGVLGRIKLELNVPNGKTRVVLEGLKRVEITNYVFDNKNYEANKTLTNEKFSDRQRRRIERNAGAQSESSYMAQWGVK